MDVAAAAYYPLTDATQLPQLAPMAANIRILGGGSNVLLCNDIRETVVHNQLRGISIIKEDEDHVWLYAAAGEVWHELVLYAIERGYGGIENLALIPGTVGASPIQNIGAYGVEVKDTIDMVHAYHWAQNRPVTYTNTECGFAYRDSIFKHELKGQVIVTGVTYKLSKKPVLNTAYGAIKDELEAMGVTNAGVQDVAAAVIRIRQSKLPDPKVVGNAGSFFKNPVVDRALFLQLLAAYPAMPSYPAGPDAVKIPAGWLIEQCGWKGFREGNAGVHPKQALVLVNYGHADGQEIWQLSQRIVDSVSQRFGIEPEREVQIWR